MIAVLSYPTTVVGGQEADQHLRGWPCDRAPGQDSVVTHRGIAPGLTGRDAARDRVRCSHGLDSLRRPLIGWPAVR